jgi:hypothetical protein
LARVGTYGVDDAIRHALRLAGVTE